MNMLLYSIHAEGLLNLIDSSTPKKPHVGSLVMISALQKSACLI